MLIDIRATVRVNTILGAFARLQRLPMTAIYKTLRKPMHLDQRDHRDKQRGPRGAWAPLASTTLAAYARLGYRRNRRILNRLPNARKTYVSARALTMRSRVYWSMIHQAGGRNGRGAWVPQRQFFWISKQLRKQAAREFRRAMWARWRGLPYP